MTELFNFPPVLKDNFYRVPKRAVLSVVAALCLVLFSAVLLIPMAQAWPTPRTEAKGGECVNGVEQPITWIVTNLETGMKNSPATIQSVQVSPSLPTTTFVPVVLQNTGKDFSTAVTTPPAGFTGNVTLTYQMVWSGSDGHDTRSGEATISVHPCVVVTTTTTSVPTTTTTIPTTTTTQATTTTIAPTTTLLPTTTTVVTTTTLPSTTTLPPTTTTEKPTTTVPTTVPTTSTEPPHETTTVPATTSTTSPPESTTNVPEVVTTVPRGSTTTSPPTVTTTVPPLPVTGVESLNRIGIAMILVGIGLGLMLLRVILDNRSGA